MAFRFFLASWCLLSLAVVATAQEKNNKHLEAVQQYNTYDSLADYYLYIGDTSNAIYNYQKAIEVDSTRTDEKKALEKLRRCFQKSANSFYLKEY